MSDTPRSGCTTSPPPRRSALGQAIHKGLASARENALPGVVLWTLAAAIVVAYYLSGDFARILEVPGSWKEGGGFLYSCLATALFGGLIPFIWRLIRRDPGLLDVPRRVVAARGLFFVGFWAWKGVEVDAFYRLQDLLFGSGASFQVIAPKVLVDQFVYNPLWAGITQILAYWWMDHGFRFRALGSKELWSTMGKRLLEVLISTWAVWIPMVTIIYSLPSRLQIPLFNLATCFWALLLASLVRESKK